jgi:hypothetical protein
MALAGMPAQARGPLPLGRAYIYTRRGCIGRLAHHANELLGYLERNQEALVHYAARRRRGEPISTSFVESSVTRSSRCAGTGRQCSPSSTCEQRC